MVLGLVVGNVMPPPCICWTAQCISLFSLPLSCSPATLEKRTRPASFAHGDRQAVEASSFAHPPALGSGKPGKVRQEWGRGERQLPNWPARTEHGCAPMGIHFALQEPFPWQPWTWQSLGSESWCRVVDGASGQLKQFPPCGHMDKAGQLKHLFPSTS